MYDTEKCKLIFEEMGRLAPEANIGAIKERRGGKLRFPIYINKELMNTDLEALELSARSSNCLRRVGYHTIGELVEGIESREDLRKIRNCGAKSVDEIMEKLFCYQYGALSEKRKVMYIREVLQLNRT